MKTNGQLLAELDSALKSITDISDMGDSVLSPQKFDQFVRRMEDNTVILPDARFIPMEAQQTDIDRTGFVGRILRSGSNSSGASRTLAEGEFANPTFNTNKLVAVELQAITSLRDRALRRNIERGDFEGTLVDLFGEAAGRDFEEYALLADSGRTHTDDDVLSKTDGWVKLAENRVLGSGLTDNTDPEEIFQALLEATPKRFLQDPSEWRIYVPWDLFDAYHDVLAARQTNLGDQSLTEGFPWLPWKGMRVQYAPMLERAPDTQDMDGADPNPDHDVWGRIATLQHPDNMAWGVFHEVTVEDEREAKERRTDFVLTIEADAHYEDENAAAVAFLDQ